MLTLYSENQLILIKVCTAKLHNAVFCCRGRISLLTSKDSVVHSIEIVFVMVGNNLSKQRQVVMLPCQPFRYFLVPRFQLGRLADDTNYHMTDILVVTETIQLILCEKKTNSANWLILFTLIALQPRLPTSVSAT